MRCVVTAGPTFEPLDAVRRLTNFSSGRLGSELAACLTSHGHEVILLIGQQATWPGERRAARVQSFTTTDTLLAALRDLAAGAVHAVFHAAAVSDFSFGRIWRRSPRDELILIRSGKFPTRHGPLLAELIPTPKILPSLRDWFPQARLVGWKYEVEGRREDLIRLAQRQISESRTDACVANGPAYGPGFALLRQDGSQLHLADSQALFEALERCIRA